LASLEVTLSNVLLPLSREPAGSEGGAVGVSRSDAQGPRGSGREHSRSPEQTGPGSTSLRFVTPPGAGCSCVRRGAGGLRGFGSRRSCSLVVAKNLEGAVDQRRQVVCAHVGGGRIAIRSLLARLRRCVVEKRYAMSILLDASRVRKFSRRSNASVIACKNAHERAGCAQNIRRFVRVEIVISYGCSGREGPSKTHVMFAACQTAACTRTLAHV
jgi:hypothetical protein